MCADRNRPIIVGDFKERQEAGGFFVTAQPTMMNHQYSQNTDNQGNPLDVMQLADEEGVLFPEEEFDGNKSNVR